MRRRTPKKLPPIEDETINQIDIDRIWKKALARGLREILNPRVCRAPAKTDAVLFPVWDKAVAEICILMRDDDRKWNTYSREEKERCMAEDCLEKSYKRFKEETLGSLAGMVDTATPRDKRGQA